MSLQPEITITGRPYRTLLEVHRAAGRSDLTRTQQELSYLPRVMQTRIILYSFEAAGRPQNVEWGWGEVYKLDSLPRLQAVVVRIAFEAFDSLNTGLRHMAAGRVCAHGWPQTENPRWGENHAKDNVEILLQSLDDIRTDLSPSEIKEILEAWVREAVSASEDRREARDRIMRFVNHLPIDGILNLNDLWLTSLPQIFHADVFTTRLKVLDLGLNQLQSLPEQIGQLQVLKNLSVVYNRLQSLPSEIGQLRALKKLFVYQNCLQFLPSEIGQLLALEELDASHNLLQSLPTEIGQLQALQRLDVRNNRLQSLPEQIGQLPALARLYYEENPLLSVPEQVLQLQEQEQEQWEPTPNYTDQVETANNYRYARAMENNTLGADYLASAIEDYLKKLTEMEKENFEKNMEDSDSSIFTLIPCLAVERAISSSIALTNGNIPEFMHKHLSELEELRKKRENFDKDKEKLSKTEITAWEKELQNQIGAIATNLHRETDFIVSMQQVLPKFSKEPKE